MLKEISSLSSIALFQGFVPFMIDRGFSKRTACGFSKLHHTIKDGYLKLFEQLKN